MSAASTTVRPAQGVLERDRLTAEILGHMKLRAATDPLVHQKIMQWVVVQKAPSQIQPSKIVGCKISSALLLQRLARAFENRQSKTKDNSSTSDNGNIGKPNKSPKKLPSLSVIIQRKVKVTQLVKQAVQFVGSDVLKVLQTLVPSLTVVDVANFCLQLLGDEIKIKEFYRIFSEASGKDPSTIDETPSIYFGVFALQALQSLRAQAIATYEFSHDFEIIYQTCYQNENFQKCMNHLNPVNSPVGGISSASFAPDTEARNICWKLARLISLKSDFKTKANPETKDHRRNRILISATSIILTANIGKAAKNSKVADTKSENFVALVAAPVAKLLEFLTENASQTQRITPIATGDILDHVKETCHLISHRGIGNRVIDNVAPSNSSLLLSNIFSPGAHQMLVRDYRTIIKNLVSDTQKELGVSIINQGERTSKRTSITDVLLFFPMVIGEPWGIHRDAPMITSKMLCLSENSKPSEPLKESVAVVMKMNPRTRVVKRKAESDTPKIPESIQTDNNKKQKIISLIEVPKDRIKRPSQQPIVIDEGAVTSPTQRSSMRLLAEKNEAPLVNDSSELNEWTLSILSLTIIKPTDTLLTYLGENDRTRGDGSSCLQDVVVPVLNRGILRILGAIRSSTNPNSEAMATTLSVGRRDGQIYVNGPVDQIVQLCASIVGLFYFSLEAIIQDQMERMDFLGSFGSQLQSRSFHRALLACSYSCLLKGVGMNPNLKVNARNEHLSVQALLDCTETDPYTFLKVIETFCRALIATKRATQQQTRTPIVSGLPIILHKYAQKIEAQLIDSVLWSTPVTSQVAGQKNFTLTIKTMKNIRGAWPPDILEPILPEEIADLEPEVSASSEVRYKPLFGSSSEANFLSFVLRKLLKLMYFRIQAICAALNLSSEGALHTQIFVAFRFLLRCHISIFNDRHVDQLLLCTIYGVCRVMKIKSKISFGEVIDAYFTVREEEQGKRACRMTVRHVRLASSGRSVGNIVVFYNTVYIPKMQKFFLGSKALKKAAESYKISCEKEERIKANQNSEKTIVATGGSTIATQSSQPISALPNSETSKISDGSDKNPISVVDLMKKLHGSNGDSTLVGEAREISKTALKNSSLSMKKNLTANGTMSNGMKKVDSKSERGKGSGDFVVVSKGSSSAETETERNGPEESTIDPSQGASKPSKTSSIQKISLPSEKTTLINGTKVSVSSTEHLKIKKTPDKVYGKAGVDQNGVLNTEKRGLKTNEATTTRATSSTTSTSSSTGEMAAS